MPCGWYSTVAVAILDDGATQGGDLPLVVERLRKVLQVSNESGLMIRRPGCYHRLQVTAGIGWELPREFFLANTSHSPGCLSSR
jgi:hypothetical protein